MFCRHCGQENNDNSIYCSSDGALLYKQKPKINLVRDKIRFCKDCGKSIEAYDLYCTDCGVSLYEKKKKGPAIEIHNIKDTKAPIIKDNLKSKLNIKSSLIYSIIGIAIVFLVGAIVSTGVNTAMEKQILNEFGIPMGVKLLNPLDVSLLLNSANFKFTMLAGNYGLGTVTLAGAPFIFLLVPFITFFLMGMGLGKNNNKLGQGVSVEGVLLTGLFYGLFIALLSLVNRAQTNFFIPYIGENISLQKNFSVLTGLLNGTLIASISLLMGYAAYWKLKKDDNLVGNLKWLFEALFIFLTGSAIVTIAAGLFIKIVLDGDTRNGFLNFALFSQMGIYAFLMINFGSFGFMEDFTEEKVSLFKNMDFIKDGLDDKAPMFLYGALLVPIVLFFLHGKKSKENGNKDIFYTTITYSILIGILAYLTHGKLTGMGLDGMLEDYFGTNFNLGFKIIYSVLGSFILSTLSTLAGFLLSSERKKEVSF